MKIAGLNFTQLVRQFFNVLTVQPGYWLGKNWSSPVSINLLINLACNSKCQTCDSWKMKEGPEILTLSDFDVLADQIRRLGIPLVTLGGGEPTIRQDFLDIIRTLKKRGLTVQMTTNALNLSEKKRKAIYDSGLDRITFSYDSHLPEVYEAIRGVNGVSQVTENLIRLLEEKPSHLEVDTNSVLCSQNAETFCKP
ncbi:MAG: radical SAM protein [Bdellovibrionota bacterium]